MHSAQRLFRPNWVVVLHFSWHIDLLLTRYDPCVTCMTLWSGTRLIKFGTHRIFTRGLTSGWPEMTSGWPLTSDMLCAQVSSSPNLIWWSYWVSQPIFLLLYLVDSCMNLIPTKCYTLVRSYSNQIPCVTFNFSNALHHGQWLLWLNLVTKFLSHIDLWVTFDFWRGCFESMLLSLGVPYCYF